jgi:hypothetical protein
MATRKLEKAQWHPFFDGMSKVLLLGKRAEIEVDSLDFGAQIEAEWLPLLGIVYDPKDDVLEIALEEEVDHLIYKPREIYVDEGLTGLESVLVVDANGIQQIVKLRDPLMLPAPSDAVS